MGSRRKVGVEVGREVAALRRPARRLRNGAHNVDEDDRERAGGGGELLSTAMAVRSNELKRCRQGVAVESAGE